MSFNSRTLIIIVVGLLGLGTLITLAFGEDPIPVDLAEITRGEMVVTVDASGKTRVRDIYEVTAPIAGTLLRLPLQVGDTVVKDETIVAEIRPISAPLLDARTRAVAIAALHETEAQIRFAQAEVTRTQTDLRYVEDQFARVEALTQRGTSSLTALEDASLQVERAKAQAISAQAGLAMAKASRDRAAAALAEPGTEGDKPDQCCLRLFAPASGVVLDQQNVSERPVSAGQSLLSVGNPDDLEVVVELLSSDATRLDIGARATLERWGGEGPLEARLARIEPTATTVVSALGIEEQRVNAVLDITSAPESWTGLGHGFSVFVRLEELRAEGQLLVPLSAVFQTKDAWFTYVAQDGRIATTAIILGPSDGRHAVVLRGLAAGDTVVTHPPDTLEDGDDIVARERF